MASLVLKAPPVEEPLRRDEARNQVRAYDPEDADDLDFWNSAARQFAERATRRQFVTATYTLHLDRWPEDCEYKLLPGGIWYRDGAIELPRPPARSVSSISYVDPDGDPQAFTDFDLDSDAEPATIRPAYSYDWPSIRDQPNAITIEYVAGYGAATAVPPDIKAIIRLLLGHAWGQRGDAEPQAIFENASTFLRSLIQNARAGG